MHHESSDDWLREGTPVEAPGRITRPPYRPPIGVPIDKGPEKRAAILSIALHLLVIALIVAPPLVAAHIDFENRGAGGAGPAGGGGGGNRGTGGIFEPVTTERLRYVQLARPVAPKPTPTPVPKPIVTPVPPPKVEPKKPDPTPPTPPVETPAKPEAAPAAPVASATPGTGGGTGADGSAGNGSGSGGGVGSGIGTGRGSGNGPGTGGGDAKVYPPTVIALPVLPLPVPSKVRPYLLQAVFEVDTLGNARLIAFNPSNDGGYNRRLREMLSEIRFRPAVRGNGRPVVDTAKITANAP